MLWSKGRRCLLWPENLLLDTSSKGGRWGRRMRPLRNGWPMALLKQQMSTRRPVRLQPKWLLMQKPRCVKSLGRLWKLPKESHGKQSVDSGKESRAWPRLC